MVGASKIDKIHTLPYPRFCQLLNNSLPDGFTKIKLQRKRDFQTQLNLPSIANRGRKGCLPQK